MIWIMQKNEDKNTIECPRCGKKMSSRHCKMVCQNCGAMYDCSDIV